MSCCRNQPQRSGLLEGPTKGGATTVQATNRGVMVNKPPHWNHVLESWCLNFSGRVRLASVKNFQLMHQCDRDEAVVMQVTLG